MVVVVLPLAVLRQLLSLGPRAVLLLLTPPLLWEVGPVPVVGVKHLSLGLVGFRPPPWSELPGQPLQVQVLAAGSAVDGIPPLLQLVQPRSPVLPRPYRLT